jgi:acyl transferase domain-containing protein
VRQKISLPTYPFQRKRYWAEAAVPTFGKKLASVHPLLGEKYSTPDNEIIYRCELHLGALPYLKDHQVYGHIIYPGAGYLEMMLAASLNGIGEGEIHLSQVSIEAALSFDAGKVVEIQTVMKPAEGGYKVAVYSQEQEANSENAAWHCHARGTVSINENLNILADFNIDNVRSRCEKIIDHKDFYEAVNSIGIYYGEEFQAVNRLYLGYWMAAYNYWRHRFGRRNRKIYICQWVVRPWIFMRHWGIKFWRTGKKQKNWKWAERVT